MRAQELEALLSAYRAGSGAEKKEIRELISKLPGAEKEIFKMTRGADMRAALRLLCDICRKKKHKEALKPLVIEDADRLLSVPDAKARKSACELIGACAAEECAGKLTEALKNERIRFVRPSIILALGNTKEPAKYLKDFEIEPGEEKHAREEAEALKKALAPRGGSRGKTNYSFPEWCAATYVSAEALKEELAAFGRSFRKSALLKDALEIRTQDLKGLRCYADALFYIGGADDFKEAADRLGEIGCRGLFYRIETGLLKPEERRETISLISRGLAAYGYTDSPSSYSFEIRVIDGRMFAVFPDDRFSYRKASVPAGINPVAAASIMRLCYPYFTDGAKVLDPFCGSGTMLIERGLIKKALSLTGVDISARAVKAANENRKASGVKFSLIRADILDHKAGGYDEIISNMPFGLRVLGHKQNIKLYHGFAAKLDSLLSENGRAFLFTQEKTLLREAVGATKRFKIIREVTVGTGGLCPSLFVIERGKNA